MNRKALDLAVSVGIPSGGSIGFNFLTEMARAEAHAPISSGDFDFSFGCASAVVGVAVAQRDV